MYTRVYLQQNVLYLYVFRQERLMYDSILLQVVHRVGQLVGIAHCLLGAKTRLC